MFHTVTFRALAVAACGWLLATDAAALAVGRASGAALVGRPLELSIPVTLDAPGEDPCASAEVFHGEERVRRAPTLRWEPGAGTQGVLRLVSPVPVDEPMVTVYLRVGCGQNSSTRRFVLLSEVPPESEAVPRARSAPAAVQPGGTASARPAATPQRSSVPAADAAAPAAPAPLGPRRRDPAPADAAVAALRAERALPPARSAAPSAPVPSRARRPERAEPQSRLKLELLELGPERAPVLRLSSELRSEPASDPQRRADAAALWQALQKSPDEALQDGLRLQAMERELRALRDQTQQNAATVAQMRGQVEQARSERGRAAGIVLALAAALLALLAWLGWRWYATLRLTRVGRWFEQHGDSHLSPLAVAREHGTPAGGAPVAAPVVATPAAGLAAATPPPAPPPPSVPAVGVGVGTGGRGGGGMGAGAGASVAAAAAASGLPGEFQVSRGGTVRMVGVEELIDVHDKADFFLSIGEYEQAIAVLEAHVHDQVETSALAWMDLLELYHSLGKRAEYERLRTEFRQRFTAQVPDFEHFDQPTASLENYGRALSRIVALWPSERVLEVIEESIFRKPGLPGAEPFSLEAYRELVLLYHVAREVALEADGEPGVRPAAYHDTSVQPLNALERAAAPATERDLLLVPPASPRVGVDIDVGEIPPLDFDLDLGAEDAAPADPGRRRG